MVKLDTVRKKVIYTSLVTFSFIGSAVSFYIGFIWVQESASIAQWNIKHAFAPIGGFCLGVLIMATIYPLGMWVMDELTN